MKLHTVYDNSFGKFSYKPTYSDGNFEKFMNFYSCSYFVCTRLVQQSKNVVMIILLVNT